MAREKVNNVRQVILLISLLLGSSCVFFGKTIHIVYLIPEGYVGNVIVVYSQTDGIIPEKENGVYIFRIPEDGILKVNIPFEKGSHKFDYFFVDNNGTRTKLEYLYPKGWIRNPGDNTSKSQDNITEDERNNRIFAMNNINSTFRVKDNVVYVNSFIVGKPKDSAIAYDRMQDRISEIQKTLLKTAN